MHHRRPDDTSPDPRVLQLVRGMVAMGMFMVATVPFARQPNPWVGNLPLWLLGMPLLSWWSLHRFRLSRVPLPPAAGKRRGRTQARAVDRRRRRRVAGAGAQQTGAIARPC